MHKLQAAVVVAGIAATCVIGGAAEAAAAGVTCGGVSYQGLSRGNACYYSDGDKILVSDVRKDGYWVYAHVVDEPVSAPYNDYFCNNKKGGGTTVTCGRNAKEGGKVRFSITVMRGDTFLASSGPISARS